MEDIVIGLLLLIVGVGLLLAGLRVFFILLPVWGGIVGFFTGATLVHAWFGDGFLATAGGWILGIILGIVFAVLSYLYWYIGAVFAIASVGTLLATGLLGLFGVDTGWVVFIIGAIAAAVFAFLAFITAAPVYMVAIGTAFAGATAALTGFLLIIDRIDLVHLRYGGAWAAMNNSWVWVLLWALLAGFGIAVQWSRITETGLPSERWVRADARAHRTAAIESNRESRAG